MSVQKNYDRDALNMSSMTPTESGKFLYESYIKDNKFMWSDLQYLGEAVSRLSSFPNPNLLLTQSIVNSIDKKNHSQESLLLLFPWLEN